MIRGSMSALVTPFKNDNLDLETYEYLIKRQIKYGMNAVVPVGTTGESATLSHDEHKACIEMAVSTCKNTNVKVLAGAGSNSTKEAIDLAKFAEKCGADAILCVTPYYNKPTQEGLLLHYKAIAQSIDIPLVVYNVPSRTGVNIETSTILRLYKEEKNIIGSKEASGQIDRIETMKTQEKDLILFSGDDALNLSILASGGDGVISVTGNLLPLEVSKLVKYILNNDLESGRKISNKLFEINKALFMQTNPIPIKVAMYLSGLIPNLEYRLPLFKPNSEFLAFVEKILKGYEVQK